MELVETYQSESTCLLELSLSEDGVLSVKSMDDLLEDTKVIINQNLQIHRRTITLGDDTKVYENQFRRKRHQN